MWKDSFPIINKYYEINNGILYNSDCLDTLKLIQNESIDLVVTSPPYDNLRFYKTKNNQELDNFWNFEVFTYIAKELYRVIKKGGVIVWVVGDATINGSESGTSFRQALFFKDLGFNIHDTMIFEKHGFPYPSNNRYHQIFEYMFVFSKGKPKTFNPIKDKKNTYAGQSNWGKSYFGRQKNGSFKEINKRITKDYSSRTNIWKYITSGGFNTKDKIAYKHPAIFPEKLAEDHIISWSNENDIVLDPFTGSGTTLKMANKLNRYFIGVEIFKEYCDIAVQRINTIPISLLKN